MKKLFAFGAVLAMASGAYAAPDVAQASQKGSALVFPDIRVDGNWATLIRISNDGDQDVDVKCYWMDGNKNRVDFVTEITKEQPFWFDAETGNGTNKVNGFPAGPSNGFAAPTFPNGNPFLPGGAGAYYKGLLACWVVDANASTQLKWNHLSGTATVYSEAGAYEYNAYAFFVASDAAFNLQEVGDPGTLALGGPGAEFYDQCPLYQIGQFSPAGYVQTNAPTIQYNRLAIATCNLRLQQDWTPEWTKLHFDVWNEDEVKFTGAYECSDSWHETEFNQGTTNWDGTGAFANKPYNNGVDSAAQNFAAGTLGTYSARYRVQGIASTQCPNSEDAGILAVQSSKLDAVNHFVGTTLAAAGKIAGSIVWQTGLDEVPEGGIR
jgi:hypothetical protein